MPGVAIYAYMTAPIVSRFGFRWLESGAMQMHFLKPLYEGDSAVVKASIPNAKGFVEASIRVENKTGTLCATGTATLNPSSHSLGEPAPELFPETPLPDINSRTVPGPETLRAGSPLGTLIETIDLSRDEPLKSLNDKLTFYRGATAVAHPFTLLSLANQALVRNFKLGPWIHTGSELVNRGTVRHGEILSVRSRVHECFERRGHDFVTIDLLLIGERNRVVQQVRHTAIYRIRTQKSVETACLPAI